MDWIRELKSTELSLDEKLHRLESTSGSSSSFFIPNQPQFILDFIHQQLRVDPLELRIWRLLIHQLTVNHSELLSLKEISSSVKSFTLIVQRALQECSNKNKDSDQLCQSVISEAFILMDKSTNFPRPSLDNYFSLWMISSNASSLRQYLEHRLLHELIPFYPQPKKLLELATQHLPFFAQHYTDEQCIQVFRAMVFHGENLAGFGDVLHALSQSQFSFTSTAVTGYQRSLFKQLGQLESDFGFLPVLFQLYVAQQQQQRSLTSATVKSRHDEFLFFEALMRILMTKMTEKKSSTDEAGLYSAMNMLLDHLANGNIVVLPSDSNYAGQDAFLTALFSQFTSSIASLDNTPAKALTSAPDSHPLIIQMIAKLVEIHDPLSTDPRHSSTLYKLITAHSINHPDSVRILVRTLMTIHSKSSRLSEWIHDFFLTHLLNNQEGVSMTKVLCGDSSFMSSLASLLLSCLTEQQVEMVCRDVFVGLERGLGLLECASGGDGGDIDQKDESSKKKKGGKSGKKRDRDGELIPCAEQDPMAIRSCVNLPSLIVLCTLLSYRYQEINEPGSRTLLSELYKKVSVSEWGPGYDDEEVTWLLYGSLLSREISTKDIKKWMKRWPDRPRTKFLQIRALLKRSSSCSQSCDSAENIKIHSKLINKIVEMLPKEIENANGVGWAWDGKFESITERYVSLAIFKELFYSISRIWHLFTQESKKRFLHFFTVVLSHRTAYTDLLILHTQSIAFYESFTPANWFPDLIQITLSSNDIKKDKERLGAVLEFLSRVPVHSLSAEQIVNSVDPLFASLNHSEKFIQGHLLTLLYNLFSRLDNNCRMNDAVTYINVLCSSNNIAISSNTETILMKLVKSALLTDGQNLFSAFSKVNSGDGDGLWWLAAAFILDETKSQLDDSFISMVQNQLSSTDINGRLLRSLIEYRVRFGLRLDAHIEDMVRNRLSSKNTDLVPLFQIVARHISAFENTTECEQVLIDLMMGEMQVDSQHWRQLLACWISSASHERIEKLYRFLNTGSLSWQYRARIFMLYSVSSDLAQQLCPVDEFIKKECFAFSNNFDGLLLLHKRISANGNDLSFEHVCRILDGISQIVHQLSPNELLTLTSSFGHEPVFELISRSLSALLKFSPSQHTKKLFPLLLNLLTNLMDVFRTRGDTNAEKRVHASQAFQRIFPVLTAHKRRMALKKYAPMLICAFVTVQQSNRRFSEDCVEGVRECIYMLLDCCGEQEKEVVMCNLDAVGKGLFRMLYAKYEQEHKFSGKT